MKVELPAKSTKPRGMSSALGARAVNVDYQPTLHAAVSLVAGYPGAIGTRLQLLRLELDMVCPDMRTRVMGVWSDSHTMVAAELRGMALGAFYHGEILERDTMTIRAFHVTPNAMPVITKVDTILGMDWVAGQPRCRQNKKLGDSALFLQQFRRKSAACRCARSHPRHTITTG